MQALLVLAVTFALLWLLFILPQQRRVRAHQQLVAALHVGDEVVLSAGIHGRITELGPEDLMLEVAPDVELRVARQAVLRRAESAIQADDAAADDTAAGAGDTDTHATGAAPQADEDDRPVGGTDASAPTDYE
jgi:preprotein translocase subunit YajC